jgi:hypothetical protein
MDSMRTDLHGKLSGPIGIIKPRTKTLITKRAVVDLNEERDAVTEAPSHTETFGIELDCPPDLRH